MKRSIAFILITGLLLSFAACGTPVKPAETQPAETVPETAPETIPETEAAVYVEETAAPEEYHEEETYSENPEEYIREALSPAQIDRVIIDGERSARVIVRPDQLSLAIGKEGQNARLAARLTGYKIDIKTEE